jgi:sialic acid synthase SpsE
MLKNLEIVAEVGQGFEGSFTLIKNLIKSANNSEVKFLKFQMVFADELATKNYKYYKLFKKLEIGYKDWSLVSKLASKNKIKLYFDIFGHKSLKICEKLRVYGIKIHPTDALNYSLINSISKSKIKRVILGIGGQHINNIEKSIKILSNKETIIMIGFQSYPTFLKSNNIKNIKIAYSKYKNFKNVSIGFADHEPESLLKSKMLSSLAIGAGAKLIEKHFTISKSLKLEDYESSLNANEFQDYSNSLHEIFEAYSENKKVNEYTLSKQETNYLKFIKRNVVAKKLIKKNKKIIISDLILKRTGDKNVIHEIEKCIGRKTKIDIKKNHSIKMKNLK